MRNQKGLEADTLGRADRNFYKIELDWELIVFPFRRLLKVKR